MLQGTIFKALSGFYYVESEAGLIECRARGKFRLDKSLPLVGDKVLIDVISDGKGVLKEIEPRKNSFVRPAVANIDKLVIIASAAIPVTDQYLIDRAVAVAELKDCEPVICINKSDLNKDERLFNVYRKIGIATVYTSAVTGEGMDELKDVMAGSVCAFTGNSGVGKSSILNILDPNLSIRTGEVSEKLGRGRHTTRHVELFRLSCGAVVADTPGFSSFDAEDGDLLVKDNIQFGFREFSDYIGKCRFSNCSHVKEQRCAIINAVSEGAIAESRYMNYVRLYEQASKIKEWELKKLKAEE